MHVIIAGSRTATCEDVFSAIEKCPFHKYISVVFSGGAKGADYYGKLWAEKQNISVQVYPAEWNKHGKSAGPIRNKVMASEADGLIAVWDGVSRGTSNMVKEAEKYELRIFLYLIHSKRGKMFFGSERNEKGWMEYEDEIMHRRK